MTPMELAEFARTGSPDPSTKVGAIVTNEDGIIVGGGFNSFPEGIPPTWWDVREQKYKAVIHAEANALLEAGRFHCLGGTIYVTSHPCRDCARLIIAAGIKKVVSPLEPWRDDPGVVETCRDAAELLDLCGVEREAP